MVPDQMAMLGALYAAIRDDRLPPEVKATAARIWKEKLAGFLARRRQRMAPPTPNRMPIPYCNRRRRTMDAEPRRRAGRVTGHRHVEACPQGTGRGGRPMTLAIDRAELARFFHALFADLDPWGYVSLRAFRQFPPNGERDQPLHIEPIRLNLGLKRVIDARHHGRIALEVPCSGTAQGMNHRRAGGIAARDQGRDIACPTPGLLVCCNPLAQFVRDSDLQPRNVAAARRRLVMRTRTSGSKPSVSAFPWQRGNCVSPSPPPKRSAARRPIKQTTTRKRSGSGAPLGSAHRHSVFDEDHRSGQLDLQHDVTAHRR